MVLKSIVTHNKDNVDELLDLNVIIERLKRLRALNKEPDKIGLMQYRWRSFSIDKLKKR
jgi:hypothetical protein